MCISICWKFNSYEKYLNFFLPFFPTEELCRDFTYRKNPISPIGRILSWSTNPSIAQIVSRVSSREARRAIVENITAKEEFSTTWSPTREFRIRACREFAPVNNKSESTNALSMILKETNAQRREETFSSPARHTEIIRLRKLCPVYRYPRPQGGPLTQRYSHAKIRNERFSAVNCITSRGLYRRNINGERPSYSFLPKYT